MLNFNNAGPQRAEQICGELTSNSSDPVAAFLEKMAEYNLNPRTIALDEGVHRFGVDKNDKTAGWYIFFPDDIAAGAFGNWKEDLVEKWCSRELSTLSWEERQAYTEKQRLAKEKRQLEEKENHARAKIRANQIWNESEPIIGQSHNYLKRKNIQAHYTKLSKNGDLIVPEIDVNGEIWALQFIKPNGEKKFQPLGRRDGLYFEILGTEHIYLCEGFSTGATIAEATGATVICAFNSGSLPKVARVLKEKNPTGTFTIAADNDQFTAENVGIKKANEAAKILSNASVVFPTFANIANKPTDFNDLAALEGKAAVSLQLGQVGKRVVFPPLSAAATLIKGRVLSCPKPKEFVWNCWGNGFMPKGVVGVLAATGGTGKTFMLLSLGVMTAAGAAFGPIEATRPAKTLIICGEDDQVEVDRRLWHITGGVFPDNLHAASVYGSVGPLMELDGNKPVKATGFHWLEETIQKHEGIELLILDPKSRFYGLDENNNDHATQWIQCLEYLANEYQINILFSAHTSEANSGKISQSMNRGASALVDGCRWQAGLIRMDEGTAKSYGIQNPRQYVILDTPKNNYAADVARPLYFKRTDTGVLQYSSPAKDYLEKLGSALISILGEDPEEYTKNDLYRAPKGKDIVGELKDKFSKNFSRSKDMEKLIDYLLAEGKLKLETTNPGRNSKEILVVT